MGKIALALAVVVATAAMAWAQSPPKDKPGVLGTLNQSGASSNGSMADMMGGVAGEGARHHAEEGSKKHRAPNTGGIASHGAPGTDDPAHDPARVQ